MFPIVPIETRTLAGGLVERLYDTDGDGCADYGEQLASSGMVSRLHYYAGRGAAALQEDVDLASLNPADCRQIIFLLDSIPYSVVRDMWDQGRLRLFHPPSRTISPFPAMTDLSFAEFFGVSPTIGVEAEYYDGTKLTDGYAVYARGDYEPWYPRVQYHVSNVLHAVIYFFPFSWTDHELRQIQDIFLRRPEKLVIGYCVGTSALGAQEGRNGHQFGLIHVDRLSQWLVHRTHGRVKITLMSDHGHNLMHSERILLPEMLTRFGYHVTDRLRRPEDVVVPQFGVVTCAAIYTHRPADVARDVAGMEGVDLVAYVEPNGTPRGSGGGVFRAPSANGSQENKPQMSQMNTDGSSYLRSSAQSADRSSSSETDRVIVLSHDGMAAISSKSGLGDPTYRYETQRGDPLQLNGILDELRRAGKVDAAGFVQDRVLFEATHAHVYPDAVQRLWRAFHGLVVNTPDVMLSIKDGWHCGSPTMTKLVYLRAAHGNLGMLSSSGFAMTMAGRLPPFMRMPDLREALRGLGIAPPAPQNPASTAEAR